MVFEDDHAVSHGPSLSPSVAKADGVNRRDQIKNVTKSAFIKNYDKKSIISVKKLSEAMSISVATIVLITIALPFFALSSFPAEVI